MTAARHGPFVLGVDGGNSKTDVALLAADGRLLAAVRGGTVSHQQVGLEAGADRLVALVGAARAAAGFGPHDPVAAQAVYCLAGADSPADIARLTAAFAARPLATSGHVLNDAFAPVRAGSDRAWLLPCLRSSHSLLRCPRGSAAYDIGAGTPVSQKSYGGRDGPAILRGGLVRKSRCVGAPGLARRRLRDRRWSC